MVLCVGLAERQTQRVRPGSGPVRMIWLEDKTRRAAAPVEADDPARDRIATDGYG